MAQEGKLQNAYPDERAAVSPRESNVGAGGASATNTPRGGVAAGQRTPRGGLPPRPRPSGGAQAAAPKGALSSSNPFAISAADGADAGAYAAAAQSPAKSPRSDTAPPLAASSGAPATALSPRTKRVVVVKKVVRRSGGDGSADGGAGAGSLHSEHTVVSVTRRTLEPGEVYTPRTGDGQAADTADVSVSLLPTGIPPASAGVITTPRGTKRTVVVTRKVIKVKKSPRGPPGIHEGGEEGGAPVGASAAPPGPVAETTHGAPLLGGDDQQAPPSAARAGEAAESTLTLRLPVASVPLGGTDDTAAAAARAAAAAAGAGAPGGEGAPDASIPRGKGSKRTPRGAAIARVAAANKTPRGTPRIPSKRIPPMAPISSPPVSPVAAAAAGADAAAPLPAPGAPEAPEALASTPRGGESHSMMAETEEELRRREQLQLLKLSGLSRKSRVGTLASGVDSPRAGGTFGHSGPRRLSSLAPSAFRASGRVPVAALRSLSRSTGSRLVGAASAVEPVRIFPCPDEDVVTTALVTAYLFVARLYPAQELAARQRATSEHFAGRRLGGGSAHSFDALVDHFKVVLSGLCGQDGWMERCRISRFALAQAPDGGFTPTKGLAVALLAHRVSDEVLRQVEEMRAEADGSGGSSADSQEDEEGVIGLRGKTKKAQHHSPSEQSSYARGGGRQKKTRKHHNAFQAFASSIQESIMGTASRRGVGVSARDRRRRAMRAAGEESVSGAAQGGAGGAQRRQPRGRSMNRIDESDDDSWEDFGASPRKRDDSGDESGAASTPPPGAGVASSGGAGTPTKEAQASAAPSGEQQPQSQPGRRQLSPEEERRRARIALRAGPPSCALSGFDAAEISRSMPASLRALAAEAGALVEFPAERIWATLLATESLLSLGESYLARDADQGGAGVVDETLVDRGRSFLREQCRRHRALREILPELREAAGARAEAWEMGSAERWQEARLSWKAQPALRNRHDLQRIAGHVVQAVRRGHETFAAVLAPPTDPVTRAQSSLVIFTAAVTLLCIGACAHTRQPAGCRMHFFISLVVCPCSQT